MLLGRKRDKGRFNAFRVLLLVAAGIFAPLVGAAAVDDGWTIILGPMPDASKPRINGSTADHSRFDVLKKKFRKVRDVNNACLSCHNEGARQIHKTKHWAWEYDSSTTGQKLGAVTSSTIFS